MSTTVVSKSILPAPYLEGFLPLLSLLCSSDSNRTGNILPPSPSRPRPITRSSSREVNVPLQEEGKKTACHMHPSAAHQTRKEPIRAGGSAFLLLCKLLDWIPRTTLPVCLPTYMPQLLFRSLRLPVVSRDACVWHSSARALCIAIR
jgi:hypothetical protein